MILTKSKEYIKSIFNKTSLKFGNFLSIKNPYSELDYLSDSFDLNINVNHFIKWLTEEGEIIEHTYHIDIIGMCQYSCAYVAMMLRFNNLKGDLVIMEGQFTNHHHWWLEYKINNTTYIIDLTIKQFIKNAPNLLVIKKSNSKEYYKSKRKGKTIYQFLRETKALIFYKDPLEIK